MKKARRVTAWFAVTVGAVFLALLLGDTLGRLTGVQSFELFTLDLRQHTTQETFQDVPGRERESEIVLVMFDEFSVLDSIEGWDWISPFPRAHLAELVHTIAGAGARTIGLDVYLGEMYPGLNRIDGGNELLRDAIDQAGNVVIVAPLEETEDGSRLVAPHPFFADVAVSVGAAELPSSFETFRNGALAVRSGDGLAPSFALSLYAHARGLNLDSILHASEEGGRVTLPGLPPQVGEVPASWKETDGDHDRSGSIVPFPIRYLGPPSSSDADAPRGTFQATPSSLVAGMASELEAADGDLLLQQLFQGSLEELFRDKIVLLGSGFHPEERFRTPFFGFSATNEGEVDDQRYDWMYGVEVHAHSLQNMLDGAYVRPLSSLPKSALLVALAMFTAGVVFLRGTAWGGVAAVATIAATWLLAFSAWAGLGGGASGSAGGYQAAGLWVPIGTPILATLLAYVGSVAYVAIVEGREKRFFKGAFGMYLSPELVDEISEDPSALELGGEKRALSLLFSDLSGFTTISENMDAQDLITLLNEYLDAMTQVVLDEGGYLDKYIGDAIMAFWNAPKEFDDHPDRAMRAAVLMQRQMAELNRRWLEGDEGREPLKVRIGVHTGEVVVGNVGGRDRFNYSAIGDAVNLAARLEPANKTYDTLNMISEETLRASRASYRVRELDRMIVKGKDEPVTVYELLELADAPLDDAKEEALRCYDAGMRAYRARDWTGALEHFQAGLERCPTDGPCAVYIERCRTYVTEPPPDDWDFVVRRSEK